MAVYFHYLFSVQIRASDMEFWNMGIENMQLRHDLKMYPPWVKMTISMKNADLSFKLPIKFNGCSDDSQLDMELTFPLGKNNREMFSLIQFQA